MTTLELIRKRRSVRTFDGSVIPPETTRKIMEYAEAASNPYDIPITWKMLDSKKEDLSCPVIVGTDVYIGGKMQKVPHAEEAFGYSFEKIVLFAQSLDVGTTWIGGTMDRGAFERAMDLKEGEFMPCVSPLGYPAKKMSVRETMMRKGIRADSRMGFGELFFHDHFGAPLAEDDAGKIRDALEAVRLSPSAVNKQPWRVVLRDNKAHFYRYRSRLTGGSSWDVQKVDMGIALCHFELVAGESGVDVSFEIADPMPGTDRDMQYIATFVIAE